MQQDKYYIVTQLATGGELFDRICEQGKFTEKDASQTIKQVLEAVDYLHSNEVVHRGKSWSRVVLSLRESNEGLSDLKPENLLYLTVDPDSSLVLADFGIAKMLGSKDEVLTTMAGSFGYAAPEVMLKRGHGKPVDMWSLGVITYTLLCGYSPFRSESITDLIEECKHGKVIFHERYWKDVSHDAKAFIGELLQPRPEDRATSKVCISQHQRLAVSTLLTSMQEALQHPWLTGKTATDHNLLPEIRAYVAKARLKRGIELVKLANRIESLKMQEDEGEDVPGEADIPAQAGEAAAKAIMNPSVGKGLSSTEGSTDPSKGKRKLSRAARSAIFREVVFAKVREQKALEERTKVEKTHTESVS